MYKPAASTREFVDRVPEGLRRSVSLEYDSTSRRNAKAADRAFEHANGTGEPLPLAPLIMNVDDDRYQIEHIDQFLRRRFTLVENGVTTELNCSRGHTDEYRSLRMAGENLLLHTGLLKRTPTTLDVAASEDYELGALQTLLVVRIER